MAEATIRGGPRLTWRRTRARVAQVVHALVDDPRVARVAILETGRSTS